MFAFVLNFTYACIGNEFSSTQTLKLVHTQRKLAGEVAMTSLPSRGGVLAGKLEFKFENNWPHVCART